MITKETFWITHGQARLEAVRWTAAEPQRTPVVLLHEGLGSCGLWRGFPGALAARTGREILAYSRSGYGASDPCVLPRPLDYMEREAAALPNILGTLGVDEFILAGHSDGASIAALAAGERPAGLRGLILMAPHFFVEDISVTAIRAARHAYETGDLRARLARHHANPDTAFRGWNEAWLDPGFRTWNITSAIAAWRVPALAIQGANDPYGTADQVNVIAEYQSDAEIHLIADCGHAPHLEAPDECMDLLTRFLDRLP